ncbi:MAG: ABC transporter permease subunit, partial [Micrococcales bacterium]|nr:ABC transporter permease subunit [Micrococcales bacterium]
MTYLPNAQAIRPGRQVRFHRVLLAEWLKLRSLRSTWWVIGVFVFITIGTGLIYAFNVEFSEFGLSGRFGEMTNRLVSEQVAAAVAGQAMVLVIMVLAVLGVLALTNEYSSGMIRSTFAAVPKRWPVLVAKAMLISTVTVILVALTALIGFVLAASQLSSQGITLVFSLAVWRMLGYGVLVSVLLVLLFLGLGALMRFSAAGIATAYGVGVVVPMLLLPLLALAAQVFEDIGNYFPISLGMSAINSGLPNAAVDLGRLPSLGYLAIWSGVAMTLGAWRFMRRDA